MANVLSLVSYNIFPAITGGQKNIALFNQNLSQHHKLTCVTVSSHSSPLADYDVLQILSPSAFRYANIFYFFTLRSIIKKRKITHVIIEHPYYGWLGILLQKICGVKLIVHSHNIEAIRFKELGKWWWPLLEIYEKFVHMIADHSFCITSEDRDYLVKHYDVKAYRTSIITYGIGLLKPPSITERAEAKNTLSTLYNISSGTTLFLFNGAYDYSPNVEALTIILTDINPQLEKIFSNYRVIICGKELPHYLNDLKSYADKNIMYLGFVPDISLLLKSCDVFINPIKNGGGIKTKLVEALGYGMTAVSTMKGATGISEAVCNGRLLVNKTNNWHDFAKLMINAVKIEVSIGDDYFEQFSWANIGAKAASVISAM
jgi:hypothetical protein